MIICIGNLYIYDILYVVIPEILYDTPIKVKNESSRQQIGNICIIPMYNTYVYIHANFYNTVCIIHIYNIELITLYRFNNLGQFILIILDTITTENREHLYTKPNKVKKTSKQTTSEMPADEINYEPSTDEVSDSEAPLEVPPQSADILYSAVNKT